METPQNLLKFWPSLTDKTISLMLYTPCLITLPLFKIEIEKIGRLEMVINREIMN